MSSVPAVSFVCPWAYVAFSPPKPSMTHPLVVSNRSFAQALINKVDVS
ncbi:hypothetical protein A2U01_0079615, partial [Trifolium medium]|nr:hypothetical protein [Trifolium medium]